MRPVEKFAPWATQYGPLLLNVIGWVALYFVVSGLLAQHDGPNAPAWTAAMNERDAQLKAMEAQLAKLESTTQKLADQMEILALQQRAQQDGLGRRLSQAEIRKLESATARLEEELANLRERTYVTVDLNTLVQRLRPNVSFGLLRVDPSKPGVADVTFQMHNLGPYAAIVDAPEVVLATKPVSLSGPIDGQLVPLEDYTVRGARAGALLPNEPRNQAYTIVLNNPRRLEQPLYYKVTFKTSTDPAVVNASSRLLQGKVPEKDIRELSVSQYGDVGEVNIAALRP